jgi:hypothetical protein
MHVQNGYAEISVLLEKVFGVEHFLVEAGHHQIIESHQMYIQL